MQQNVKGRIWIWLADHVYGRIGTDSPHWVQSWALKHWNVNWITDPISWLDSRDLLQPTVRTEESWKHAPPTFCDGISESKRGCVCKINDNNNTNDKHTSMSVVPCSARTPGNGGRCRCLIRTKFGWFFKTARCQSGQKKENLRKSHGWTSGQKTRQISRPGVIVQTIGLIMVKILWPKYLYIICTICNC